MARLKDYYLKDVAPALMKKFGYKKRHADPETR